MLVGAKSPREDVIDLLWWLVSKCPHNTYWLTTHCQRGCNRCAEYLRRRQFPEEIVEAVDRAFKPTEWDVLKTEAIDFTRDFVWLEDAPLQSEMRALRERAALDRLILMDRNDPRMARRALQQLMALSEQPD